MPPLNTGVAAATVRVNETELVVPALEVAVYVTVEVPAVVDDPLKVRVDALKLKPLGKPLAL
jgi:hypothetical protein